MLPEGHEKVLTYLGLYVLLKKEYDSFTFLMNFAGTPPYKESGSVNFFVITDPAPNTL